MFGTYKPEDVTVLLKDITGLVEPQSTEERERQIQGGRHYCEMLPVEYEPSPAYEKTFEDAIARYSGITAMATCSVAEKIMGANGENVVLVSLARAGTPIGILIKHCIKLKYGVDVPHYTISIIRGRGIDKNAMNYILSRHDAANIRFVDGWTGKGAIRRELCKAMEEFPGVDPGLAVLSDPAYVASMCGTHDDFLIASSCLNSTVSGLLSRTFLRSDIIGEEDFHGAVFYEHLKNRDVTYHFIDEVERRFAECGAKCPEDNAKGVKKPETQGIIPELAEESAEPAEPGKTAPETAAPASPALSEVQSIAEEFGIKDINLIKPSIGEATRVLLRRLPWKILVHSLNDEEHLGHLYQLAREKGVEVAEYPLKCYRACGIIKSLADA